MTTFFNTKGKRISLGEQIAAGGEGTIFNVKNDTDTVAKIFHQQSSERKQRKLLAMTEFTHSSSANEILSTCAWPIDVLRKSETSYEVAGFLMPKVTNCENIHLLYGVKSRRKYFSHARWKFLVYTSLNLSHSFKVLHENGIVVGDVNHGSVMVSNKANVRFVDCDSFQLNSNGRVLPCDVGTGTHTPPELQSTELRNVERTQNHDYFGLAVLIFQLLFLGRHPFAGTPIGQNDLTVEQSIQGGRFAYGDDARSRNMIQPPGTPPLSIVPFEKFFYRAFLSQDRPSCSEWISALYQLKDQIDECTSNNGHEYWKGLSQCPWCRIEQKARISLFERIYKTVRNFELKSTWQEIETLSRSTWFSTRTALRGLLPTSGNFRSLPIQIWFVLALYYCLIGIISYSVAISTIPFPQSYDLLGGALLVAYIGYAYLATFVGSNLVKRIERKRLKGARDEYERLPAFETELNEKLRSKARENQLRNFLDRYRIDDHSIPNIGGIRTSTLLSYGIETAADIEMRRIMRIPGFGISLAGDLRAWRRDIEARFVFNPSAAITNSELEEVKRIVREKTLALQDQLLQGIDSLKKLGTDPPRANYFFTIVLPVIAVLIVGLNLQSIRNWSNSFSKQPIASRADATTTGPSDRELANVGVANNTESNTNVDPKLSADSLFQTGIIATRNRRYREAVDLYLSVIALSPEHVGAWHELSYAQLKLGNSDKAIDAAKRSLSLRPDHRESEYVLGMALLAREDFTDAADVFLRLTRRNDRKAEDFYFLGLSLVGDQEYEAATENLQKAILLRPKWAAALYELGRAQLSTGNSTDAWETYERLVVVDARLAEKLHKLFE